MTRTKSAPTPATSQNYVSQRQLSKLVSTPTLTEDKALPTTSHPPNVSASTFAPKFPIYSPLFSSLFLSFLFFSFLLVSLLFLILTSPLSPPSFLPGLHGCAPLGNDLLFPLSLPLFSGLVAKPLNALTPTNIFSFRVYWGVCRKQAGIAWHFELSPQCDGEKGPTWLS